jgi:hypothetical protein
VGRSLTRKIIDEHLVAGEAQAGAAVAAVAIAVGGLYARRRRAG